MKAIFSILVLLLLSFVAQAKLHHKAHSLPRHRPQEIAFQDYCLSEAMYFEAGNQSEKGKIAVGYVVLNRAQTRRISPCAVIAQKSGGRYEFPWYGNRPLRRRAKYRQQWNDSQRLARILLHRNNLPDPTSGATAFRGKRDSKRWFADRCIPTAVIGGHTFYRIKRQRN